MADRHCSERSRRREIWGDWFNLHQLSQISRRAPLAVCVLLFRAISRRACTISFIIPSLLYSSFLCAQQLDSHELVPSLNILSPTPSADTAPTIFVMNSQRYAIPRNFIASTEEGKDGAPAVISMRALLPDVTGLTRETMRCLDYRDRCSERVMTIGLWKGEHAVPGSKILENIQFMVLPDKFVGPCGLEFYETKSYENSRTQYFFKKLEQDADVSVLKCDKHGAYPGCHSNADIGDGNHVYYIFHRVHICQWQNIRKKIFERIGSFREELAK